MTLEAKIETLTNAVEALTKQMHDLEAALAIPPAGKLGAPEETEQKEEPKNEQVKAPEVTHEELQQLCLKIVRDDRSKKKALKNVLADYDATLVADVPQDKLAELKSKLESV